MSNDRPVSRWIEENIIAVSPELRDSTLFRFKVRLQVVIGKDGKGRPKYKELEVDILPDLALDYEVLEQQMQDLPSQYAFWATVYSEVRMGVAIAERKLKMRHGLALEKVQKEFFDQKLKPTAEVLKRIVEKDVDLLKADLEYQQVQMQCGKLYHMVEALKMKAELARSLAGFKRQEQDKTQT